MYHPPFSYIFQRFHLWHVKLVMVKKNSHIAQFYHLKFVGVASFASFTLLSKGGIPIVFNRT